MFHWGMTKAIVKIFEMAGKRTVPYKSSVLFRELALMLGEQAIQVISALT
ncbi:hypothetical protein [Lactococcus taiwanensis]